MGYLNRPIFYILKRNLKNIFRKEIDKRMDLITIALAKKAGASGGANGDPGILTKLENSVKEVQSEIKSVQKDVELLLPLAQGAVLAIEVGGTTVKLTENVLKLPLPLATGEVLGLVKSTPADSENSINKISVNSDGSMEVNALSSDKLVAGEETLIFNGNYENYFYETKGEKLL